MKRRSFLQMPLAAGLSGLGGPVSQLTVSKPDAFRRLPSNVAGLIRGVLAKEPESFNTDWYGTLAVEGLLRWSRRGLPEGLGFAQEWFEFHAAHDQGLSDEEFWRTYNGPRSRIIRGRVLPFTMYSGFFGLPFPCHLLHQITGDPRARQVCLDVADAILHRAARERHGLVLHDDSVWSSELGDSFTIPDTIYFAARSLMIASQLEARIGDVYRDQALHQILTCTELFLDGAKGLARTVLTPKGVGRTFWCRASGWLAYALAGVLRYLPRSHAAFAGLATDLQRLADGLSRFQGPSGGLHVLVDQPDTPEETTSTAMCVAAIREATVNEWIPDRYSEFLRRGWHFVEDHVEEGGTVSSVYTGWAMTAESGEILIDQSPRFRGWIAGVIMHAADEMTP